MKERPILFSAPMIRAILADKKSQTRRTIKMPASWDCFVCADWGNGWWPYKSDDGENPSFDNNEIPLNCPYGTVSDHLIVKEAAWMWCERRPNGQTKTGRQKWKYVPMREAPIHYAADHPTKPSIKVVSPDTGNEWGWRFKIGRFLPRWASRIDLEVTGVRVEQLQDISYEDAIAEGIINPATVPPFPHQSTETVEQFARRTNYPQRSYAALWEEINGPGSWDANPWIWCVEFRRVTP